MAKKGQLPRRDFLKQAAGATGAFAQLAHWQPLSSAEQSASGSKSPSSPHATSLPEDTFAYPRKFTADQLKMISFPLGGVGAGSLGLGGRGQLRDWEIFNRPNQGYSPNYAFPSIWVQSGSHAPVARVLEAKILPPYQGEAGLGWQNVPGLTRLQSATFTGEYPLAHVAFDDPDLPVNVTLDAFSPFIPHDPDNSGLPAAILRYRITNTQPQQAKVSIAFSIENPVHHGNQHMASQQNRNKVNDQLAAINMSNPGLPSDHPMAGTFTLAALRHPQVRMSHWLGWPKASWWNSPLFFWDAFSQTGELAPHNSESNNVAALCQSITLNPGQSGTLTFILAWHFPNRTPEWCGWKSPTGKEHTIIGNHYATRFPDAFGVATYTAANLATLQAQTETFASALRTSTLPAPVIEAATANLSTLASTTCFRTADGEFHGFEGSNDKLGCCFGNCTHVWNYETATAFLFPSLSRSLRKAAFGFSEDPEGGIRARQLLPDGEQRSTIIALDGHMGEIMHAYLDWKLSGNREWLQQMWPRIQKAISFAWVPNGWDPSKTGVAAGVQNNTYDVAFFGPNPQCGIYYLGALRACQEMATALGDNQSAELYHKLFSHGSRWIDSNLFNGAYYQQHVIGYAMDDIHPSLRIGTSGMANPEQPQFQVGEGCLVDQLVGQYLASIMNLGDLVSSANIQRTLQSIYDYNYKRTLIHHDSVERCFALNDEAAMVICDYPDGKRPRIPFPYFAEVMTGFEYSTAVLMLYSGMVPQGVECIRNIRNRYDGLKRNPWDEAECGHHYARAMASWSAIVALSGFAYDGHTQSVTAIPRLVNDNFQCFWSTATGWGTFTVTRAASSTRFSLQVLSGKLQCRSCQLPGQARSTTARIKQTPLGHTTVVSADATTATFTTPVTLSKNDSLALELHL